MRTFNSIVGFPPTTANTSDSVLVIIDPQNEYASGQLAIPEPVLTDTRAVIARLLEQYRAAGGAIVHVLHQAHDDTWPVFTPGTPLAEELPEFAPRDGEPVVWKRWPGSFAESNLKEVVDATGLRKIVLVGYMAHVCVSTTAREGHQLGYGVVVVEDAVGDRNIPGANGEEVTKMVMLELADIFATVVSSGDIK
ncbi:Isochorismatase-like protein [Mycena filopes]|nr:Isochorismatase-like protein [Mycena filopes]